ncbi:MAG: glycosyltransferase [Patescibacteria group bacterium]
MLELGLFFSVYGLFALSHIIIQMIVAHSEHRKQHHDEFITFHAGHSASVSAVVPVFNEEPKILLQCIRALESQVWGGVEILVVDDGSMNRETLESEVYSKVRGDKVMVLLAEKNIGKRHAQKMAFDIARGDIVVTIDSDTILRSPKSFQEIVRRFKNPKVGAVTGDVRVENAHQNILTKLISYRYWTAFHQERAAQSYFSVLMCCSGPFSAYRRSVLGQVKEAYVSQTFLGKPCTFGDDRHLTNLVLEQEWDVVFDAKAIAYTHVPNTFTQYVRQQIRWNKSFYREMFWTFKHATKHHWYLLYDLLHQCVMPFLLIAALTYVLYHVAVTGRGEFLFWYLFILVGISLLRSLYGMYRTKDKNFLLFTLYGFIHVFLLVPTRIFALSTLGQTKWGTRGVAALSKSDRGFYHPERIIYAISIVLIAGFLGEIGYVLFSPGSTDAVSTQISVETTRPTQNEEEVPRAENNSQDVVDSRPTFEEIGYFAVAQRGDSAHVMIRKIVQEYATDRGITLEPWERVYIETGLVRQLDDTSLRVGERIDVAASEIGNWTEKIPTQTSSQISKWTYYASVAGLR